VLCSGQRFDVEVRRGGGAYICGEETALFSSLEGKRGEPRSKPPFPVQSGVFRSPTVINNVETLANVPHILSMGGDAYAQIGVPALTGTKLFCLSGHVSRPGVYEVPGGTRLRDLIELAGGVPNGRSLQAVLLGGAAGTFVPLEHLDAPLSPDVLGPLGLTIGSGSAIVFDESVDMWDVARQLAEFFAEESCGQCVPCRIGTRRQVEILHRISAGAGRPDDVELLRELGAVMADASICGLGQTASSAVVSALKVFSPPVGAHHA
jgi:NADH-quinone oxidoreductase subunit F